MSAAGGSKGGLTWLILAAALAVPGFLFYNWSSRLRSEHDRGVAAKARSRAGETSVFQTAPPGTRPAPLGVAASTTPAAMPGAGAGLARPVSLPGLAAPALAGAPANPPLAAGPGVAVPPRAAPGAPPAVPGSLAGTPGAASVSTAAAAGAPGVAASTGTTVVLSRDPMMSPMDLVRLREAEIEKENERKRLEEEARLARMPKKSHVRKQPPIETRIELQGIVATPEGVNMAIVNGSTVNQGENFTVDGYKGSVRIVRITAAEVTFDYQKRRFKMGVAAE